MGCMPDYDEDCEGKKPKGCMCVRCCYGENWAIIRRERMKLPIKKKYFDEIKNGSKNIEYRDAHITFVCEETGETLRKEVIKTWIANIDQSMKIKGIIEDDKIICFELKWKKVIQHSLRANSYLRVAIGLLRIDKEK